MRKRVLLVLCALLLLTGTALSQFYRYTKQGFSLRLALDNRGSFGRVSYPGVIGNSNYNPDSIGLEYPIGQRYEHIFGAGIWVGGILDTSNIPGVERKIKAVSTGYEGWSGPYWEFFPGASPADTIFKIFNQSSGTYPGRYPPKPDAWDSPSGLEGALPYNPISDADYYMKYDDYNHTNIAQHVPLHLKVFQSSYAWNAEYADAIMILEYRIINNGSKQIDSAFIGFFFEADVGPYDLANYAQHNFTGYFPDTRTAYIHNPQDAGSTPVGCSLLWAAGHAGHQLDSAVNFSFRWWPGTQHPGTDLLRYARLSSGTIDSNQSISNLTDTRCLFGFGPFTLYPSNPPLPGHPPDTLKIAVAIVSGYDPRGNHLRTMSDNANRALDIYLNQGVRLPAIPPSPPLRVVVGDRKVHLNWLWTPADSMNGGRPNPVANWDSTNQRAREHPEWTGVEGYTSRISPPFPEGNDGSRGGRNFESFRLWRSESPDDDPAKESYTLVKQWDVAGDSIEYETGFGPHPQFDFVDSNLVRGKRYHYSVTSRSIPNLVPISVVIGGVLQTILVEVDALESTIRTNNVTIDIPFAVSKELGKVRVVPNPYRTDRDYTFESGGYEKSIYGWTENKRVIKFINLPPSCIIRVFSLAGDLIRRIDHDGGGGPFPRGDTEMPLLSESNRALASGVYIFTVESSLGTQVGKFVIIR